MALNAIILCKLKNILIKYYDTSKAMVYSNNKNYTDSKTARMQNLYHLQNLTDFLETGKSSG